MEAEINHVLDQFERGKLSRREAVARIGLAAMAGVAGQAAVKADEAPTFQATELNHIALRVTNVQRSRDFYRKHLGLTVSRESESNCFMTCGNNFVALFRGDQAAMDHYCYSVKDYAVLTAADKLKAEGIEPDVHATAGRIYFPDPDGLTVQLAAESHRP